MRTWALQAVEDSMSECSLDLSRDRIFHSLNRGPFPHMMTMDEVLPYMRCLYHWITRSATARPSLNAGPKPPCVCARMKWIGGKIDRVRTAVDKEEAGQIEVERIAFSLCHNRLVDYDISIEADCHCTWADTLRKTAFAFDDEWPRDGSSRGGLSRWNRDGGRCWHRCLYEITVHQYSKPMYARWQVRAYVAAFGHKAGP